MRRKPSSKDRLKKRVMSLYLEPRQHAALKKLSAATGAPVQYYIRIAIDALLAQHGEGK